MIKNFSKDFKTTFKVWFGPYLMIFVRDADDFKKILTSEESFDKVNLMYDKIIDFGLLTLGGDTYRLHRKIVIPVFFPTNLKSYFPIIREKMNDFLKRFDDRLDSSDELEFCHLAQDFTFETIMATMFSKDDVTEHERLEYVHASET